MNFFAVSAAFWQRRLQLCTNVSIQTVRTKQRNSKWRDQSRSHFNFSSFLAAPGNALRYVCRILLKFHPTFSLSQRVRHWETDCGVRRDALRHHTFTRKRERDQTFWKMNKKLRTIQPMIDSYISLVARQYFQQSRCCSNARSAQTKLAPKQFESASINWLSRSVAIRKEEIWFKIASEEANYWENWNKWEESHDITHSNSKHIRMRATHVKWENCVVESTTFSNVLLMRRRRRNFHKNVINSQPPFQHTSTHTPHLQNEHQFIPSNISQFFTLFSNILDQR